MNTTIQRLDGTTYDLAVLGIATRDFVVSSPSPRHFTETVDARHGVIDMGTVYDARPIRASFYAEASNADDYALRRDEIFRLFRTQEPFYVTESRNPNKRWLVKVENSFGLEQHRVFGFFDVEFVAPSGFSESTEAVLDEFSVSTFQVNNAGDIDVNPRYLSLAITYIGPSSNLSIANQTTGDTWSYTGTSLGTDTITLDGVRATKNGLSIYRNTNRKLITLAPGVNDFTLTGAQAPFDISFAFRYHYL